MKKFLIDFLTFVLFVAAIVCFYFAATGVFTSALLNFILFFSAVYLVIQAAGLIDRSNGFGKYAKDNSPTVPNKVEESSTKEDGDPQSPIPILEHYDN